MAIDASMRSFAVTDEQRRRFDDDGYFVLDAFFPAAEMDALRAHIDRFVEAHTARLNQVGVEGISRANEISFTAWLAGQDDAIRDFVAQPAFVTLTTGLIGPDVSLYWDQAVYKQPEAKRDFPWHQDNGYGAVEPQTYVTVWLALDDVPVESGAIWVLPGSHRQGILPHQDTEIGKQCYFGDDPGVAVPLKKGGMAVFSSLLVHRSGPNTSERVRKGYVIQYTPAGARNGETGEPFNRLVIARDGQPAIARAS